LGPALFAWLSGRPIAVDGVLIAILVASSALVAALCVSGPAVLAQSQHFIYALGWVVAAVITIAIMFIPIAMLPRVGLAVVVGPIGGLLVHVGWLMIATRRP